MGERVAQEAAIVWSGPGHIQEPWGVPWDQSGTVGLKALLMAVKQPRLVEDIAPTAGY